MNRLNAPTVSRSGFARRVHGRSPRPFSNTPSVNTTTFPDLINGRDDGLLRSGARGGLTVLSWFYGGAVRLRNAAYDRGWKPIHRAPVPVLSVGNVTAGGTGKTPFVAWLADWFRSRNIRPALLSRGYRAVSDTGNDEKRVLDHLCPDVPHIQNADRVAGARRAVREHDAELLILDDGFQHRRLARDLDLVLVDASKPWGYGHLLPRGLLREPLSCLRRADLVVLTRADQCPPAAKREILQRIADLRGDACCIEAAFAPTRLRNAEGDAAELDSLRDRPVAAFCGIGNPDAFRQSLADARFRVETFTAFPDHHHYSPGELAEVADRARQSGAVAILTTRKDLVKIDRARLDTRPLWAVDVGTRILKGEELLEQRLQCVLPAAAAKEFPQ